VSCPANSAGSSVSSGCACNAGYAGTITATTIPNYYSGSCEAVACPENSFGPSVTQGCSCNQGFTGTIVASTSFPFFSGSCELLYCPTLNLAHSTAPVTAQANSNGFLYCEAGYGDVHGNQQTNFHQLYCNWNGVWEPEASCDPFNCSATIPSGPGYSTNCENLRTDESCTQSCLAGYRDNAEVTTHDYSCPAGVFIGDLPECVAIACPRTAIPNSNYATSNSVFGSTDAVLSVTCDVGYFGSGDIICVASTQSSSVWTSLTCSANSCAATQVANSNKATTGSITGITGASVSVACNEGYSGSGSSVCGTNGVFSTITCSANSCTATQVANSNLAATGSITGTTGTSVEVTCDSGDSGLAVCGNDGSFSNFVCPDTTTSNSNMTNTLNGQDKFAPGFAIFGLLALLL